MISPRTSSSHSSIIALLTTLNKALDGNEFYSAIFLDIRQAYYELWYKSIQQTLPYLYSLLLTSHLTARYFQTKQGVQYSACVFGTQDV